MIPEFMITFREGLEAFLVVGIIFAYLAKTNKTELNKYAAYGTISGIVASVVVAVAFVALSINFSGRNEELFEGIVMLIAAGVLTSMIMWMGREGANIKQNIERDISTRTTYGLTFLTFILVFREGIETVLFLGAAAFGNDSNMLPGALGGLITAAAISYIVFRTSTHLDLHMFFKVTGIFLILFAAGLTAHGVHELQEAGVVPIIVEHVWDINHIFDEKGTAGSLAKSLLGYNGNPSLLEVLSYLGYYGGLAAGLGHIRKRQQIAVDKASC
ncbi:MAG: FTR1 family protein [Methanosarcinales archaeon]|nr:FTR1 family protein [Methanosarcinales archaeon]